ncbi:MAG: plasmid mobilization protein [Flavipsychrobacter sp.]
MARPHKGGEDKRDFVFKVRLSQPEKKSLLNLAADAGLSPSDFVRVKTIGGKPQTKKATPEREALIGLGAELNRVGNNINQIARALNRKADSDGLAGLPIESVNAALAEFKELAALITKELGYGHPGE